MLVSIVCTSSKEWARVGLLPLLGVNVFNVDNACLKSERFLNGWVPFPTYRERSTNCSCSKSILLLTCDRCDLHLQERPMHDKLLHLDCFQSFAHGISDLARIGHGFLHSFFCISFPSYWPGNILCFLEVSHICGREVFPS